MVAMEIIYPAQIVWASRIVLVVKDDETLRFCVDYRELSAVTIQDLYQISWMYESPNFLGNTTIRSTLNAITGYEQVEISEQVHDKTAFTSPHGLFCFTRMQFGLKSSPGTFQGEIDVLVRRVKWQFALFHLDSIIILLQPTDEYIEHVQQVLTISNETDVTINLKIWEFFASRMDYLGHAIPPWHIEVSKRTIDAVHGLKCPTNLTELRYSLDYVTSCDVLFRVSQGLPSHSIESYVKINCRLSKGFATRKSQPWSR